MRKKSTGILLLLPFLGLTALVLASAAVVLVQSLGVIPAFGLTEPTLEYYCAALTDGDFLRSLGVSLYTSFVSALTAAVLGVAVAAALTAAKSKKMTALIRVPILVPHAVAAVFMVTILAQTGLLPRLLHALGLLSDPGEFPQLLYTESFFGVILAYLWKEIPFVAYFVLSLMASVSETLGQAAENLGASPLRSFFTITLPMTMPAIFHAFLIIFIFAFGGYELPLLLGPTLPKALPVAAHLRFSSPDLLDRPYAMAHNAILLLISCFMAAVLFLVMRALTRRTGGEG